MIKLTNPRYDHDGVLVIPDKEIELFAYRQLRDYNKHHFKDPHALDIDDFVENYLAIRVGYHGLSLDKSKLGATALADGVMPILDSTNMLLLREVKRGQVFIDCEACDWKECRIRFSLGHEAWHSQFDTSVNLSTLDISEPISDTYFDLFSRAGRLKRSPREWMEHHANRYAAYLLMPSVFVKKLWKKYHDEFFKGRRITSNSPKKLWKVIHCIADDLSVAQSSIALRLIELGIISNEMYKSLNTKKWKEEQ